MRKWHWEANPVEKKKNVYTPLEVKSKKTRLRKRVKEELKKESMKMELALLVCLVFSFKMRFFGLVGGLRAV